MKNADFRKWQAALGATLSVLLAFTLAWASPMGGGFSQAAALGVVTADAVPMSDGAASGEGQAASKTVLDAAAESEASDAANAGAFEQAAADVGRAEPEVEESSAEPASGAEAVLAQTDADEAQRAAEERATDVDELGYVPGEIVVIYEEDASVSEQSDVAATIGTEGEPEPASFETGDAAVVDIVDEITVDTAVEAASAEDAVKYAFPNYVAKSFDEPVASAQSSAASPLATGDELASQQWYLSAVKAPEAWSLLAAPGRSIEPVKVAVLDTGASISHSDLQDSIDMSRSGEVVWVDMQAGKVSFKPLRGDGYLNGTNEMPFYSTHGTHVVGIIGAKAGNGGVLGVASGGSTALANKIVSIAAIDIFSCIGENNDGTKFSSATVLDILYGLAKARDMGCSVVNMSLGFYTDDETCIAALNEKTSELDEQGVVQVCAAGNDHTAAKSYPAACDATLSVISLSKRGAIPSNSSTYSMKTWESADGYMRSWFSNYGDWCDIAAPGENIFSTGVFEGTLKNGYLSMSGTSMASPVVAAAAALVQAADPDLSASEVKDVLCRTAADLHAAGKGNESGWGLVNAEAAVKAALPSSQPEGPGVEPDIPEEEPPASLANAKLAIPSLTYTGKVQTPAVSVTLGGATLVQGRDYRAAISPATVKAVGTYSVTVEGVGAYRGTLRGSFKVNAADISSAQIQAIGSQNYTGKAVTPQPKVTWQSVTLAAGTDYAVSYANNVNAGTAKMAISGKGNFTGTKSVNFSIVKVDRNVWKTVGGKTYYYGADGQPVKLVPEDRRLLVLLQRRRRHAEGLDHLARRNQELLRLGREGPDRLAQLRRREVLLRPGHGRVQALEPEDRRQVVLLRRQERHAEGLGHLVRRHQELLPPRLLGARRGPHRLAQLQRREVLLRPGHGHFEALEPEDRRQVVLLRLLLPHEGRLGHLVRRHQELLPPRLLGARRGPHRLAQLQRREVLLRFFDWQKSSLGTEN